MDKRKLLVWMSLVVCLMLGGRVLAQGNQDETSLYMPLVTRSDVLPSITLDLVSIVPDAFTSPTEITHAGDGSGRLFVAELPGVIRIVRNGMLESTPFLDIRTRVLSGGEQGLLGLVFHPEYENNGYFYVNYTREPDGDTVIARYEVSSSDPDQADPTSELQILTIDQPDTNHNGGKLAFGPDGYLYIATGDGGGAGDPDNNALSLNSLLGKLLRLDVDGSQPYAIPPDNPFSSGGGLPEIWAYGLRNPWRFSFDPLKGDLFIGDVGQGDWEEIDYEPAGTPGGVNYGWRCFEGTHVYSTSDPCDDPAYLATLEMPIIEFSHALGRSVTGGFVYRGSAQPDMYGRYIYGDYISGRIWYTYQRANGSFAEPEIAAENTGIGISTFGEDEAGEIYVADYVDGLIYHLEVQAASR